MPGITIDWDDTLALGSPEYATYTTYPGFLATSSVQIDQAARCTLRVKVWTMQVAHLLETGHFDAHGKFQPDTSQVINSTVVSTSPPQLRNGGGSVNSESDIYRGTLGAEWSFTSNPAGGYLITTMWMAASGDLSFRFDLLVAIYVPEASGAFTASTGTTDAGPALITFVDQSWTLVPGSDQPVVYSSGDPNSTNAFRVTLQSVQITPTEYWSYGGKYDTTTGAPASNGAA